LLGCALTQGPFLAASALISGRTDGQYAEGMKLAADYLQRSGYRLPTEAEWEYACRAGAVTSRYYGETDELLGKYAWYLSNAAADRSWPVGLLKPNDIGLFDMHGNVWTWCQEKYRSYAVGKDGTPIEDNEDSLVVNDKEIRPLRGGAYTNPGFLVRSATRHRILPATPNGAVGLRPARTFVP
jgi:formylglycine-generating enzyme required for sulfatase activity